MTSFFMIIKTIDEWTCHKAADNGTNTNDKQAPRNKPATLLCCVSHRVAIFCSFGAKMLIFGPMEKHLVPGFKVGKKTHPNPIPNPKNAIWAKLSCFIQSHCKNSSGT